MWNKIHRCLKENAGNQTKQRKRWGKKYSNYKSSTRDDETRIGRKRDRADKGRLVMPMVPLLSVVEVGEVLAAAEVDEGNVEVINPELVAKNVGDEGDVGVLTVGIARVGAE